MYKNVCFWIVKQECMVLFWRPSRSQIGASLQAPFGVATLERQNLDKNKLTEHWLQREPLALQKHSKATRT